MKKIIIVLLMIIIVLVSVNMPVLANSTNVSFEINGEVFVSPSGEPAPYINKDQRTMVPIRFFANALEVSDEDISWDQETRTATVTREENTVSVTIGKPYILVNGVQVDMDTVAEIEQSRTFIPVRYIAEGLGATIEWNGDLNLVIIETEFEEEIVPEFTYELPNDSALIEGFNALHREYLNEEIPDIAYEASYYFFKPVDGQFLFKEGEFGEEYNYTLKETLNPHINQQVYDATKVLLTEDHYVRTAFYLGDDNFKSIVHVNFAKSAAYARNGNNFFGFTFYEDEPFNNKANWLNEYGNFSENVAITLTLAKLWDNPSSDVHIETLYKHKLHSALIAIFGEKDGNDIMEYVMEQYMNIRNIGTISRDELMKVREVKTFENVKLDFAGDFTQSFHFTYIK